MCTGMCVVENCLPGGSVCLSSAQLYSLVASPDSQLHELYWPSYCSLLPSDADGKGALPRASPQKLDLAGFDMGLYQCNCIKKYGDLPKAPWKKEH